MLHLASQSPRRHALLSRLGLAFTVLDVDVDEHRQAGEDADAYVCRVAADKARAGLLQLASPADAVVLGADTEVILDGEVFGKPRDANDAARMLERLSGRTHRVVSAVSVVASGREARTVSVSEVSIAPLTRAGIACYLDGGEWIGKAGAYAIQGSAEAWVSHLSGSHSGVMGLPMHATARLLHSFGLAVPMFGPAAAPAPLIARHG